MDSLTLDFLAMGISADSESESCNIGKLARSEQMVHDSKSLPSTTQSLPRKRSKTVHSTAVKECTLERKNIADSGPSS